MKKDYGFKCDCGNTATVEFEPDELKSVVCRCGAPMWRDFSGIGIGGDLPSRHPFGFSKTAIGSDDDMADGSVLKEVDYVEKHHGPSAREQNTATNMINQLAKDRRTCQRKEICDEAFAKVDFAPPKGLDLTDGTA